MSAAMDYKTISPVTGAMGFSDLEEDCLRQTIPRLCLVTAETVAREPENSIRTGC